MSKQKKPSNKSHTNALRLFRDGVQYGCSTDIGGETSYGYGQLDEFGFWEYPLYFEVEPQPSQVQDKLPSHETVSREATEEVQEKQCPDPLVKSGCEFVHCKYAARDEGGKSYCKDPNEYKNADGDYVCGRRDDAILVEPTPTLRERMPSGLTLKQEFDFALPLVDLIYPREELLNRLVKISETHFKAKLEEIQKYIDENNIYQVVFEHYEGIKWMPLQTKKVNIKEVLK